MEKKLDLIIGELQNLNKKVDRIETEAKSFRSEMNKKIGSIQEQVVKNSEAINVIIHGNNNNEHQF